ncbi:endolytic transglycosylase MltG [Isoptericola sp. S6320L]|uniref:endolytic transglycosylase MltG n=1 Tax=Isoptericola sp. S6320L TaxID=2926411 RepID=UPI001FF693A6|nr:endolytic transglycosylase MltG [Isoptericola sp. S6320L]MCK0115519.1 endolytic transglycosylase MltG [Isoptericola sp. S6320L]
MTDLFEHSTAQRPTAPPSRVRSAASKRAARKRRRRRQQRTAVIMVVLLGLLGAGGVFFWDRLSGSLSGFDLALFNSAPEDYEGSGTDPVQVVIPEGATGSQMGQVLAEADVVASVGAFNEAFESAPGAAGIQPGTYELYTQMSAANAVDALLANEKIETEVTIPEGYTVEQVVDRVASVTEFSREELEEALADPKAIGLPKSADGNPEGWLFPKTYNVQPDDEAVDLLSTMVDQTKAELDSLGVDDGDRQEVLTKASLIEREAKFEPDRPKMARAIQNRLDRGMILQIDAAVAYGLGKSGTELTRADLDDPDNPYNLYAHVGLPPTPIASPGASSIEAVMNPADGDWIFWVAVNLETGETKFSETNEQHNIYRQELEEWMAENS